MTALIETVRVRGGKAPLWDLHQARMAKSCLELGVPQPIMEPPPAGPDRVVQYIVVIGEQRSEPEEPAGIKERPVGSTAPVRLIVSGEVHFPYPHKTTERGQFDRALEEARAAGKDDALLLTSTGHVAEAAIWTLFWWEGEKVATPSLELGVLPGVARARLAKLLGGLRERRIGVDELKRQSLFLANAARGVVQVAALDGDPMPPDPRTVRLQETFWP